MAIVFVVCLITSNFYVQRMFQVGNLQFQLSGAAILFPVTYIINDCLTEVYGYKKTMFVVWTGFALSIVFALVSALLCIMPMPIDAQGRSLAAAFNSLFALVPRTTAASLAAFVVGSSFNSLVLSKMKVATNGRHFNWRAIISTVCGESLDSAIFFPVAFLGILDTRALIILMLSELAIKILFEILVLPLTNRIVRQLKITEQIDTFDNNISYNPFKI